MHNNKFFILITIITFLFFCTCSTPTLAVAAVNSYDKYIISAKLNVEKLEIQANETIYYTNRRDLGFNELYLHVYPNAPSFKSLGGSIEIRKISIDGKEAKFIVTGEDRTILKIFLPTPLLPSSSIKIEISFKVKIPIKEDRFGYYAGVFALAHWYPIMAVYDERGWNLDPYWDAGESFYFECAYYNITFSVPEGYVMAATGRLDEIKKKAGEWIYKWYTPLPVREFAAAVSKNYEVVSGEASVGRRKVKVYSYYLLGHEVAGEIALNTAIKSIELYSKYYGEYAYSEFRVVEVYGWFGGMEYPMFVMITSSLYSPQRKTILELVVAHETAHNWWYGMVGNHEGLEPIMDEPFAEYSDTLYFKWVYGEKKFEEIFDLTVRRPYYRFLKIRDKDYPIAWSVFDFGADSQAYFTIVYNKGAMVLRMLNWLMGDAKYFELMHRLQEKYRFKICKLRDFKVEAERVYGASLDWFFNSWVYGSGVPHYSVETYAKQTGLTYTLHLKVKNTGDPVIALVPVRINTRLTSITVTLWVNGTQGEKDISLPFEPLTVQVDPNDIVPGEDDNKPVPVKLNIMKALNVDVALLITIILLSLVDFAGIKKIENRGHKGRK